MTTKKATTKKDIAELVELLQREGIKELSFTVGENDLRFSHATKPEEKNRMAQTLRKLEEAWKADPSLRLGQLILNAVKLSKLPERSDLPLAEVDEKTLLEALTSLADVYNVEDDVIRGGLRFLASGRVEPQ